MDISHRKVKKQLQFVDAQGKPLANKQIKVQQTKHEFLFGCGAFDFIPYVNEDKEGYKQLTDSWLDLFNYANLFQWLALHNPDGNCFTVAQVYSFTYFRHIASFLRASPDIQVQNNDTDMRLLTG